MFLIPLAIVALLAALLEKRNFDALRFRGLSIFLSGLIVFIGLAIGVMGYIVSAAARWS